MVPCILRNSLYCLQLSEELRRRRINVQPILYPAVEEMQETLGNGPAVATETLGMEMEPDPGMSTDAL